MVSVSIFAFMTTFLLAKYGNFNQSIFLTNLAYDVAIAVRSAQAYGLNVRDQAGTGGGEFGISYGVYLEADSTGSSAGSKKFILFSEPKDDTKTYTTGGNSSDTEIQRFDIKRNMFVSEIRLSNNCSGGVTSVSNVSVVFTRPDPSASIKSGSNVYNCAQIVLQSPDETKMSVIVRKTGQISVENVAVQ